MNIFKKLAALVLCLCMLMSVAAIAETTETAAMPELNDTDVLLTINGEAVTWAQAKSYYEGFVLDYGSYYDMTLPENIELFRAVAMENAYHEVLLMQKASEKGLTLDEAGQTEALAEADAIWEENLAYYITQYYPDLTTESPEADLTAAREEAIAYMNDNGFSQEYIRDNYAKSKVFSALYEDVVKDVAVTDADVEADYQARVEQDKALYENDIDAYVAYNSNVDMNNMYAMYGYTDTVMDYAWYRPAGFRGVQHILLSVDESLMQEYQNVQAQLEEQMTGEEAAEGEAEATVTQADLDNAKAAILAASQDKIDEINQRLANGEDFAALIPEYTLDSDTIYEVSVASTATYVPEFVEAAFSVDNVGDVSAPYISQFGIHIVKYVSDIPAGPIEMTEEQRTARLESLLAERQDALYTEVVDGWLAESTIEYTGIITSYNDLMNNEAAAEEEAAVEETAAEETVSEEAAVEETAAE